jgi:protein TonB
MPREIFREVAGGENQHTGRQWYTVPLSMLTHTVLIAMFIAIPLFMSEALPTPASVLVFAAPPPPPVATVPSPDVKPRPVTDVPESNPNVAPQTAPEGFTPEPPPTLTKWVEGLMEGVTKAGNAFSSLAGPPSVPPPPKPVVPIRPGGVIKAPSKMRDAVPVYPTIAKAAHVQGTVYLEATIAKDGSVKDLKVLSAPSMLDDAALTAVRQWRYTPSLLNGEPVEVLMTVTVRFALQ